MEGGFVLFAVSSYPVLRRGQKLPPERGWWSPNFWGPWYRARVAARGTAVPHGRQKPARFKSVRSHPEVTMNRIGE